MAGPWEDIDHKSALLWVNDHLEEIVTITVEARDLTLPVLSVTLKLAHHSKTTSPTNPDDMESVSGLYMHADSGSAGATLNLAERLPSFQLRRGDDWEQLRTCLGGEVFLTIQGDPSERGA